MHPTSRALSAALLVPALAVCLVLGACGSSSKGASSASASVAAPASSSASTSTGSASAGQSTKAAVVRKRDTTPPVTVAPTTDAPAPTGPVVATPGASPSTQLVGPAASGSTSAVYAKVDGIWHSMTWTMYDHTDQEDPTTGRYQWDCVGMTDYVLAQSAPQANDALRSAEQTRSGYVPSPAAYARFLASLPAGGTSLWLPVAQVSAVQPGDVIAVPPVAGSTEDGHAMIAAGPPVRLADGSYALLVYDSTAVPAHGPYDTRTWDKRDAPLPGNRPSGLGSGTVQLTVDANGAPQTLHWSVGGPAYGAGLQIGRALG